MEINSIKSIGFYNHTLLHPVSGSPVRDGEGNETVLVIASPNEDGYRQRQQKLNKELRELALMSDKGAGVDRASARAAAIAVVDWSGITVDGKPVADDPVKALDDPRMAWLVNQILNVQATSANFIETSASA